MGHNRNLADYAHHFDGTHIDLGSGNIETQGVITFEDVSNVDSVGVVTARAGVKIPDSQKVLLGTGDDLEIFHNGGQVNEGFVDNKTGNLNIRNFADDKDIVIKSDNGSGGLANYILCDGSTGAVELSHYGSLKLSTAAGGVNIGGNLNLNGADSYEVRLGANNDLKLYHDGSHSYIDDTGTGNLKVRSNNFRVSNADESKISATFVPAGAVELYNNHSKKFETTSSGVEVTGTLDLSAIDTSISDTATDIFVYDTSKDSDGGAWRHRTQYTSWYNETLNTATRGSRKEFPAVAVIVSTTTKVTIYDGDDPDLPMWMVFNAGNNGINNVPLLQYFGQDGYPTAALNGVLVLGQRTSGDNWGNPIVNFISEYIVRADPHGGEGGVFNGGVAQRHDNVGFNSPGKLTINDSRINAVAMTVQPNAPIDPATGLPTPTIALAHQAGIAVIHDVNNGTVYDINTDASVGSYVDFLDFYNGTNIVCSWGTVTTGTRNTYTYNILNQTADHTADDVEIRNARYVDSTTGGGSFIHYSQGAARITKVLGLKDNTFIMVPNTYAPALTLIDEDTERGDAGGMSAFIHTDFNTGWMPGKTRLAALSSTSTTNLTNGQTDTDRSPKNNHLTVTGTISKTAVGTGSDLVYYSGYSSSNYLTKNGMPAPGTGDFSVSAWIKPTNLNGGYFHLFSLGTSSTGGQASSTGFVLKFTTNTSAQSNGISPYFFAGAGSNQGSYNANNYLALNTWGHIVGMRRNGVAYIYINGKKVQTGNSWTTNITDTYLTVFHGIGYGEHGGVCQTSLLRYSLTAPSDRQVQRMYDDEKMLFQDNAKATVYGSSTVNALAYDEVQDTYHVATPNGRSDFRGLRRINNTTTAVSTAISAHDGFIVEQ